MQELADRAGITKFTLGKVERGDLTVGLGVAFEVAALVGVPLFHEDRPQLSADLDRARDRIALLPQRVRARREEAVKDGFVVADRGLRPESGRPAHNRGGGCRQAASHRGHRRLQLRPQLPGPR